MLILKSPFLALTVIICLSIELEPIKYQREKRIISRIKLITEDMINFFFINNGFQNRTTKLLI
jgi:hypothetical protein